MRPSLPVPAGRWHCREVELSVRTWQRWQLSQRENVYQAARAANPKRWSGPTRNWEWQETGNGKGVPRSIQSGKTRPHKSTWSDNFIDTYLRSLPERYGHWKKIYNRFSRCAKAGIINCIFNKLLQILDAKILVDWEAIALNGSNFRVLKAAAGAKKNTPMNSVVMGWVALEVALVSKSLWRQP